MEEYDKGYELYTQVGTSSWKRWWSRQGFVYDYINEGKLKYDKWGYCEPCECTSPIYRESCLVCGSIF